MIPLSGTLLTIQGISEVFRAIICIKTGEWPARMASAEETEKILMRKSHKGEDTDVI
jgi:TRAP-type mannitol/chloroaromatic compound transport system permease small subunit